MARHHHELRRAGGQHLVVPAGCESADLHRPAGVRHGARRRARSAARRAHGDCHRAVLVLLRPAQARPTLRLPHRPAHRDPQRRLRTVGRAVAVAAARRRVAVAVRCGRLVAVLRPAGGDARAKHRLGGCRSGHHGAADHHGHRARELLPDPAPAHRGRRGARRHALGDAAHDGVALRPLRRAQRLDARPGTRPGGNHGRAHDPVPGGELLPQPAAGGTAPDDRREHCRAVPRGQPQRRRRAHHYRPGAVRHHPHRQLRGAVDHHRQEGSSMSTTPTASRRAPQPDPALADALATRKRFDPRRLTDRAMTLVVGGAFLLALVPLVSLLWTVVAGGIERLSPYFLTVSMRGVFGGMDAGGIYHAIVGTLLITGVAAIISVPLGLLTAIYLVEYGRGPLARAVTFVVDVMTGIPSIVAGLFAYALFAIILGPGVRMGVVGAVALSVLMLPIVIRSSEEMLRLVPHDLREASYALGVPKWRTIISVVLRTAFGGLGTGVMLAVARIIGETAPLLLTVGVIDSINTNVFDGRMMTLPVYVYGQYTQGLVPCGPDAVDCIATINYDRAWAAALTLIIIVMLLNLVARLLTRYFPPQEGL